MESGSDLLSRAVSSQVPSALKGLTSVFGMGTGGSLSPLPPENCEGLCSPLSSWFLLRHLITEASILETFRTSTLSSSIAYTLKTAHPNFKHL